eukprot:365424-Chlamydomonas_euryale.AAC.31
MCTHRGRIGLLLLCAQYSCPGWRGEGLCGIAQGYAQWRSHCDSVQPRCLIPSVLTQAYPSWVRSLREYTSSAEPCGYRGRCALAGSRQHGGLSPRPP